MAKIYPDTNRLLDFYRAGFDSIELFDQLETYKSHLILTEQTINEFRRNRVKTLKTVLNELKKTIQVAGPHTSALLRSLPGHGDLAELMNNYRKKGEEIQKYLERFIDDESKDPVAQKFLALAGNVKTLKLTDDAVKRAHRRKLLGNPPCSAEKFSVGDEVIWETLLEGLKEDLIVVTRDQTFHDNKSLLSDEYQCDTPRRSLLITEAFSEALKKVGERPSEKLIEAEGKERAKEREAISLLQEAFSRVQLDLEALGIAPNVQKNALPAH